MVATRVAGARIHQAGPEVKVRGALTEGVSVMEVAMETAEQTVPAAWAVMGISQDCVVVVLWVAAVAALRVVFEGAGKAMDVEKVKVTVVVALVREDQGKVANVASLGPAEVGTAAVRWAAEAGERRSRSSHHQTHNLNTWSLRHRHRTQSPH